MRAFFEFLVMSKACTANLVPVPRRVMGFGPPPAAFLATSARALHRGVGRLVREQCPASRATLADVQDSRSALRTHRD